MKIPDADFVARKNETAQIILALQDQAVLAQVCAILKTTHTPKSDLEAIDKSIAEYALSGGTPLEEYLKELEAL